MASTTGLMTFAEADRLPEPQAFQYELRGGELVALTWPAFKHYWVQKQFERLLEHAAGPSWLVGTEFGFRALDEHEFRRADVACVPMERCRTIEPGGQLRGAPDIVIEVLSPSNTASGIQQYEKLCLENGSREFWVANIDLRQVKVTTPDGVTRTYHSGDKIPLPLFGNETLDVDPIFAEL